MSDKVLGLGIILALSAVLVFKVHAVELRERVKAEQDAEAVEVETSTAETPTTETQAAKKQGDMVEEPLIPAEDEDIEEPLVPCEPHIETPSVETISAETPTTETATKERRRTKRDSCIVFKTTAYCPCKECSGKYGDHTATGRRARAKHTIAVDPKVISYGTKVKIDGVTYTAEDCGGNVRGRHIDIYFNNHADVERYGVKYKKVRAKKWS